MKISVVLPVLLPDEYCIWMTRFAIAALHSQARGPFELVVVESGTRHFAEPSHDPLQRVDKYLHLEAPGGVVHDWNAGADLATGDLLVHTGSDVFAGEGWDAAMREPFELYADCGISSTSVMELGALIGHNEPVPGLIVEGWYGPFMCFRNAWRFDPAYHSWCADNDLIMRIYDNNLRCYRNYASVASHLNRATYRRLDQGQGFGGRWLAALEQSEELFYGRWGNSPLWAYGVMRGTVVYGKEHAARATPTPPQQRAKARDAASKGGPR